MVHAVVLARAGLNVGYCAEMLVSSITSALSLDSQQQTHLQPEFPISEVSGLHDRRPHLSQLSGWLDSISLWMQTCDRPKRILQNWKARTE